MSSESPQNDSQIPTTLDIFGDICWLLRSVKDYIADPESLARECEEFLSVHQEVDDEKFQECAQEVGLLDALCRAMDRNTRHEPLQFFSCEIVSIVCEKRSVARSGHAQAIAATIVKAMKAHKDSARLQNSGLSVFYGIASQADNWTKADLADVLKDKDVCEVVVEAMRTHQHIPQIQFMGVDVVFRRFKGGNAAIARMRKVRAVAVILEATNTLIQENRDGTDGDLTDDGLTLAISEFEVCCRAISILYMETNNSSSSSSASTVHVTEPYTCEEARLGFICDAMAKYGPTHRVLQTAGMTAIVHATLRSVENRAHLGLQGIKAVFAACCAHEGNQTLIFVAMQALTTLTKESECNCMHVAEPSRLQALNRIMRMHVHDENILSSCVCLIGLLSHYNPKTAQPIIEAGCIKTIVACMETYEQRYAETSVLKVALDTIAQTLDIQYNTAMPEHVVDTGIANFILRIMGMYKSDHFVQLRGCIVQYSVAFHYTTSSLHLIFDQTLVVLVDAILAFPDDLELHFNALNALFMLLERVCEVETLGSSWQALMGRNHGIEALTRCLELCLKDNMYQPTHAHTSISKGDAKDDVTQRTCTFTGFPLSDLWPHSVYLTYILLAYTICANPENQSRCTNEGTIEAVIGLLSLHRYDAKLLDAGCNALCASSEHHALNTALVAEKGGMKYIARASKLSSLEGPKRDMLMHLLENFKRGGNRSVISAVKTAQMREAQKMEEACTACGKTRAQQGMKPLLMCSACTIQPKYCSMECQKACWAAHKADCKAHRKASSQ
jgi:hypothetical protein